MHLLPALLLLPATLSLSLHQLPPNQAVMAPSSAETSKPTTYFGYGSNLWLHQMEQRCPTSKYLGVARLNGYKWIINDRGYANVVQIPRKNEPKADENENKEEVTEEDWSTVVYGLVFSLLPADESRLDRNEGVPIAYTKENLPCDFWAGYDKHGEVRKVNTTQPPTKTEVEMLVYIDRERTQIAKPREEYVYRMNMGIRDALAMGVPEGYVKEVMRGFIPEKSGEGARELAKKQAGRFVDESGVFVRED